MTLSTQELDLGAPAEQLRICDKIWLKGARWNLTDIALLQRLSELGEEVLAF
jgi:hypothetical protein